MATLSLPLTRLVHENLSVVMTFCFSRLALEKLLSTKFHGEWKYLRKGVLEVSEQRAEKACLELAMFLRILDDAEDLSGHLKDSKFPGFGKLHFSDKPVADLKMRDVCNKIIHASSLRWSFESPEKPILICESRETERWERAEVDVVTLAAYCGNLMH